MLKHMVTWEGHDGQTTTRTAYFNLTRYEVAHDMELEKLEARFLAFQENVVEDDDRDMTPPEIREMLDIFKVLIKHAYGIRSQDGKRFTKNEEVWNEFVETGCFDAFIFDMFKDANRANAFMNGIWPKEIQEAAAKVRAERPDLQPVSDDGQVPDMTPRQASDDGIPSITSVPDILEDQPSGKPWNEYTKKELLDLSEDEFQKVVQNATDGKNVPYQLLAIGMERMNVGGQTE